jgi:hypothetical protein
VESGSEFGLAGLERLRHSALVNRVRSNDFGRIYDEARILVATLRQEKAPRLDHRDAIPRRSDAAFVTVVETERFSAAEIATRIPAVLW